MTTIGKIKMAIEALTPEDFANLRVWFSEKDWEAWDQQIEQDVTAGKLDFLMEEAFFEKKQDKLREL